MSALIGTVIVLAITIAGIATALFMGAPVLVRMQERAALENMVGQLEEVRAAGNDMFLPDEARYPTISIPSGRLVLEPGTHAMVTVDFDDNRFEDPDTTTYDACDFRIHGWEDFDSAVTVSATGCVGGAGSRQLVNACPPPDDDLCVAAARVAGGTETALTDSDADATDLVLDDGNAANGADLRADSDYVFRLKDGAGNVYAEAWLLHMQRLKWSTGGVHAGYEGGAVIAQEGDAFFLSASPAVSEDPLGGPFFLRFTTMQGGSEGQLTGSTSHSVGLVLEGGHVRTDYVSTRLVRLDFHGEFAEAWCNAFFLRDVFASLDADYYRDVANAWATDGPDGDAAPDGGDSDPGHACSPDSPDADGIRSVKYVEDDPTTGPLDPQPFPFTLSQTIIHASLVI